MSQIKIPPSVVDMQSNHVEDGRVHRVHHPIEVGHMHLDKRSSDSQRRGPMEQPRPPQSWRPADQQFDRYASAVGRPDTASSTAGAVRVRVARPRFMDDTALRLLQQMAERQRGAFVATVRALLAAAAISGFIVWCSAAVGVWVAYDRDQAFGRFALLSVGLLLPMLLYWSTRRQHRQTMPEQSAAPTGRVDRVLQTFTAVGVDSGIFAGGLGLLFLLTHNWQLASEQDFTLVPWLTAWIQAQQPLWGDGLLLHENLVAGALIVLLPLAVVTLRQTWYAPPALYRYCAIGGTAIGMIALVLTFSRGAWLGLVAGAVVAVYLHWRTDNERQPRRTEQAVVRQPGVRVSSSHARGPRAGYPYRKPRQTSKQSFFIKGLTNLRLMTTHVALLDWLMGSTVFIGLALLVSITVSPLLHDLLLRPIAGTYLEMNINSRIAVWQDVLPLIGDYPYTGSGLGSTPMVLASYVYLLHVPYLNHAHNLYLQVAVEQGLPGLIGLLGLIISTGGLGLLWLQYGNQAERRLAASALAAQVGLLVYGCTDAELYVGLFAPLLFLPFALLIACAPWVEATEIDALCGQPQGVRRHSRWAVGIGLVVPVAAILVLFLLPGHQARWIVNQATVAQTRQELALYEWPDWPIQDALRRSDQIDTANWVADYEAVLTMERRNVTAARRLGQILLSQGAYAQAAQLLSAAYAGAPQQRATRQLLGEAKALLGDQAQAAALWRTVDMSQGQLDLRLWWYEHVGDRSEIRQFAQVVDRATQAP